MRRYQKLKRVVTLLFLFVNFITVYQSATLASFGRTPLAHEVLAITDQSHTAKDARAPAFSQNTRWTNQDLRKSAGEGRGSK